MEIIVGISNRHAHLTQEQVEVLFGKGYELTFFKNIRQQDDFVSNEKIQVVGPKGSLKDVRIVGPVRKKAQIEMTLTNARTIGVEGVLRISEDVKGTQGVKLIGPSGEYVLSEGVIVAKRHIHLNPKEAGLFNLNEGDQVSVQTEGDRSLTFHNVVIRIDPLYSAELHLDTDEANAAGVKHGDRATLIL